MAADYDEATVAEMKDIIKAMLQMNSSTFIFAMYEAGKELGYDTEVCNVIWAMAQWFESRKA